MRLENHFAWNTCLVHWFLTELLLQKMKRNWLVAKALLQSVE